MRYTPVQSAEESPGGFLVTVASACNTAAGTELNACCAVIVDICVSFKWDGWLTSIESGKRYVWPDEDMRR